ncbi:MAG: alpha/beta fold hydrolase [Anaerolineae bacterium]|jgi:pimeloyl-ACP methyl ester carboxylesterase
MPYVSVSGQKVYYAHRRPVPAAQAPVVFVHGAGGTHQHWLYQVRDLPQAVSYAPDLPGHGRSGGLGRDRVPAYGDWLMSFLDELALQEAVLVGHSMGGAIILEMALRYPKRVAGLGLVATGARLRVAPALLEALRQEPEVGVKLIAEWAFGPEASEEMVRLARRQMTMIPPDVLYGDFLACDGFDVVARLGEIEAPAFVLCGTQDRMTPVKYATYLRDEIDGATLTLVEGAGHMVMLEQPQAVSMALAHFLES